MTEGTQDASDDRSNVPWVCFHCGASNEPRFLLCRGCSRRQDFQTDVFTHPSEGYPSSSSSSSRPTRSARLSTRSTAADNIRGVDTIDPMLLDDPSDRDVFPGPFRWRRPPQNEVGSEGENYEDNDLLGRPSVHVYRDDIDVLDLLEEWQPHVDPAHDMLNVGYIPHDTGGHHHGGAPSSSAGLKAPWCRQDPRHSTTDTDGLALGDQGDLEDGSARSSYFTAASRLSRQSEREGSGVADEWLEDSAGEEDPELLAGEIQDTGRIAARLRGAVAKARYGTNYGNLVQPKPPPAPMRCRPVRPKLLRIPGRDGRDSQTSGNSSSDSGGGSDNADQNTSAQQES